MAETVEYALVVLASTLFVAGSVATYASFSSFESGLQFKAEVQAVSSLVSVALVNGSSEATLSMAPSTLSCTSGILSLSSGSSNESLGVGLPCAFRVNLAPGPHALAFAVDSDRFTLSVR